MEVKGNQNIFDFVLEKFGTLENLFDDVLVPNNLPVDREIQSNQEININAVGKGDDDVKMKISEQGLSMGNGDIPIIVEYRNGIVTDAVFGETAVFDFEAKINSSTPVVFTVNWGVEVGTTTINSTLVNGVWKALQTSIEIPLGVDTSQTVNVSDTLGGSYAVPYTVESALPTVGMVAYYPFNGNADDESVNSNDGTVNGATLTTDRFSNPNKAYSFNGTTDYILIPNSSDFNFGTGDFTICLWMYAISGGNINLIDRGRNTGNAGRVIVQLRSGTEPSFYVGGTLFNIPASDLGVNTWYSIICERDGDDISLYVDNSLLGTQSGAALKDITNSDTMTFGARGDQTFGFLEGKLDDIILYDRLLTPEEKTLIYEFES